MRSILGEFIFRINFQKLNRGAVVHDKGHTDSGGGAVGLNQDIFSFQFAFQVIHLEGDMGNGPDEFGKRRVREKSHPFDTIRACVEARNIKLEFFQIGFILPHDIAGDTQMMIFSHCFLLKVCFYWFINILAGDLIFGSRIADFKIFKDKSTGSMPRRAC
jgi:hypothetical protein